MTYWHFTSQEHFKEIKRRGLILPTESNVGSPLKFLQPYGAHYGPDVVWLLDTPRLDYPHGLEGSVQDKTAVAIEVNIPAVKWLEWLPAQEMNPKWREMFLSRAGGEEAADHWYVWPTVIRQKRWVGIKEKLSEN